jgi:AcrR family transcriptional regulator
MRRRAARHRPRTKPPEERHDELMNAAQHLFLEHGVEPTTIEQITWGAGVAKGTFYLYFSSKEDVLAALRERFAQDLLARIKAAILERPAKDWKGKLAAWAQAGLAAYLDSIRLHEIIFYETLSPTREGLARNIVIDHLCKLLQDGADAGAWSIGDPRCTAIFMFSGLHGLMESHDTWEPRPTRTQIADSLERLCFRAVGLPPG